MDAFRQRSLVRLFAFITGAMFLNMSFFLAEVSALKISDRGLIENIAKLVSSSGFEEERDGESAKGEAGVKDGYFLTLQVQIHQSLFLIAEKANHTWENLYPHANYSLTFTPPPDFTFFS
ncbi:MAG: hypothetical protein WAZ98_13615 [Cyclobacteriaceae bacterium]